MLHLVGSSILLYLIYLLFKSCYFPNHIMCGLWAFRTNNSITGRIKTGIPRSVEKQSKDHHICVVTKIMSAPNTNKPTIYYSPKNLHLSPSCNTIITYCVQHTPYILCLIAWEDKGTKLHIRCWNAVISLYSITIQ